VHVKNEKVREHGMVIKHQIIIFLMVPKFILDPSSIYSSSAPVSTVLLFTPT